MCPLSAVGTDNMVNMVYGTTWYNICNMVQHGADAIANGLSRPGAMGVGLTKTHGCYDAVLHLHG